jgi:predicted metalloprotease
MRFRRGARLDTSQVEDNRGASGAGFGFPKVAMAGGGGVFGVIVLLLTLFLRGTGGEGQYGATGPRVPGDNSNLATDCATGAAADQRTDCRVVAVVNSVQAYWSSTLSGRGVAYSSAPTVLYTQNVSTGCGSADSAVGPFYCPADGRVYLDLSFFDDMRTQLGAMGGTFAQAYVIAHEYGHHVQDLLGDEARVGNDRRGATSASVRLELQADCYAGVWAHHAENTRFVESISAADVRDGLDAAASVGDDRLQRRAAGSVDPDSFTHGTSAQRQRWFMRGYNSGLSGDCDTFSATSL